jgi:GTPase SAR1 family protein
LTYARARFRFELLERNVLSVLESLCPDVPRILVGTETDKKEVKYDHHHPTAVPLSFSHFVEKLHFHATVFTSSMSNR